MRPAGSGTAESLRAPAGATSTRRAPGKAPSEALRALAADPARFGLAAAPLAIGGDMPLDHDGAIDGLSFWYAANILQGPGAFVLIADGFEDFSRAMRLKLLRELQPLLLGALP